MQRAAANELTLVTGAGGLLGRYVVAAMERRGLACLAACRPGKLDSLSEALASVGAGAVAKVEFDFTTATELPAGAVRVIHAAAITKFADQDGEPHRTNAAGFANLLAACDRSDVRELHLVSTAFATGRRDGWVPERVDLDAAGVYRNAYEKSKAAAERMMVAWLEKSRGRRGTILRPSIIVGEHATGRTFKYDGFYIVAKAMRLLSDHVRRRGQASNRLRLRVPASAAAVQNLVPVDWVANMIAHVANAPSAWGQVVHLTCPAPPTNALLKRVLESHFGLSGTTFGTADQPVGDESQQRLFDGASDAVSGYFDRQPVWLRMNAARLEQEFGLPCPAWEEASLRRLVAVADADEFGRNDRPRRAQASLAVARYFNEFLPDAADKSLILRAVGMTISIRFDVGGQSYQCKFERGELEHVEPGQNLDVDVVYGCEEHVFWEVVSGRADVQRLFLEGRADVEGDLEKGIKLAVVLSAFGREFPCDGTFAESTGREVVAIGGAA